MAREFGSEAPDPAGYRFCDPSSALLSRIVRSNVKSDESVKYLDEDSRPGAIGYLALTP